MNIIETERLELRSASPALLRAELAGRAALAAEMNVVVPAEWPPEHWDEGPVRWSLDKLAAHGPAVERFLAYYFVLKADGSTRILVGVGGLKGPPENGRIEVGYSILPEFQRRGLATEAVGGFLRFAFAHDDIDEVIAETLPHLTPSIGVLAKHNFDFLGDGSETGIIRYGLRRAAWYDHNPIPPT